MLSAECILSCLFRVLAVITVFGFALILIESQTIQAAYVTSST